MKCKAQWNVTPSWHKGNNPCQDGWSSHRKMAFIGTRPETNSSELGTSFKALLSLVSNTSPSEQAERVHYHFLDLRGKQSSNIVFTATRRKKLLFPDRTYIRPLMTWKSRGERSSLYMHILSFLEMFLDLADTNESFASNGYNSLVVLWGFFYFTAISRRMIWWFVCGDSPASFSPHLRRIYGMAIVLPKTHSHLFTNCLLFLW